MNTILAKLKSKTTLVAVLTSVITIARALGAPISDGLSEIILTGAVILIGILAKDSK